MRVLMLGVNHRTAAVELRERLTLAGDRLAVVIDKLRAAHPALEVVILSTCNRTEIYLARPAHEPPAVEDVARWLNEAGPAPEGRVVRDWLRSYVPEYSPRGS